MQRYITTFIIFLIISISAGSENLPLLGSVTSGLTERQENILGSAWLRNLRNQTSEVESPLMLDYTNNIVNRLKQHSNLAGKQFTIICLEDSSINAFAVPGGIIGIHTGLIRKVNHENQLLAVVAHEISHLELRHFNAQLANNSTLSTLEVMSVLAAIIVYPQSADAGQAIFAASIGGGTSSQLAYSRTLESEADQRAGAILEGAGIPQSSITSMLELLNRESRIAGARVPEYLQTHPLTETRLSDSAKFFAATDTRNPTNSLDFEMLRLETGGHYSAESKSADYATTLKNADRLMAANELTRSGELLSKIEPVIGHEIEFQLRWSDFLSRSDRLDDAVNYLINKTLLHPESIRLNLKLATLYNLRQQKALARQYIRKAIEEQPTTPWLWSRLATTGEQQKSWNNLEAESQYLWLTGKEEAAMRLLEVSSTDPEWSSINRSRIRDRLASYKDKLDQLKDI